MLSMIEDGKTKKNTSLYYRINFQWDDKITTLPGLYLFTVGIYGPLSVFGAATECSVFLLRGMNLIISVANFYIIYSILQSLDTLVSYWVFDHFIHLSLHIIFVDIFTFRNKSKEIIKSGKLLIFLYFQ